MGRPADLIAITPFYANFILTNQGPTLSVLRVIRLVKVFQIFKLGRHSSGLKIFAKAMKASLYEFGLLLFFLIITVILFATLIFIAEMEFNQPGFRSIPESFWFALITITSVGYGDVSPSGLAGKLIASFFIIMGIIISTLPLVIIVENFERFYQHERDLENLCKRTK